MDTVTAPAPIKTSNATFAGKPGKWLGKSAFLDLNTGAISEHSLSSEHKGDPYWMQKRALNYARSVCEDMAANYNGDQSVRLCTIPAADADSYGRHLRYLHDKQKRRGGPPVMFWRSEQAADGSITYVVPAAINDPAVARFPVLRSDENRDGAALVEAAIYSTFLHSEPTTKITAGGAAPKMRSRPPSTKVKLGVTTDLTAFDRVIAKAKQIARTTGMRIVATAYDTSRYLSWWGKPNVHVDSATWERWANELAVVYAP